MTTVLLTVDTELSYGAHQRGVSGSDNLARYIDGRGAGAAVGIGHQLAVLRQHGVKAVFFVESLFTRVLGEELLARIVGPILADGHEVQLHVHTEWLYSMAEDPVNGARGINLSDFTVDDQATLIEIGAQALVRAGAPAPTAFRAGNFGANADTLRALQRVGIAWDSSLNAAIGQQCGLNQSVPNWRRPSEPEPGLIEVPVTCFSDRPGGLRPLQVCAVSTPEMSHVLRQAAQGSQACAVIVSHSFELMNPDRSGPSRLLVDRFERLCGLLDAHRETLPSGGFADIRRDRVLNGPEHRLSSNVFRTAGRVVEQVLERFQ